MCFRKFGVVDMIKLNRIGNKLGLAGAVGVLLAIGMVANQMVTESRIEEGSERATRSQQVADNSLSAHIDLRKIQLAASAVRLARNAGRGRKDHRRFAAPQGERRRRNWRLRSQPPSGRMPGNGCRRSRP